MTAVSGHVGSASWWIPIIFLLYNVQLSCPATFKRSKITLKDNGYEGILITIDENVKARAELLDNIKATFSQASQDLLSATRNRVFFRNLIVFLPEKWSEICKSSLYLCQKSTNESAETANIIIGNRKVPFTRQKKGCGQEGDFIYISTENFIKKEQKGFKLNVKNIIHEWAHLRWGLFDEINSRRGVFPTCYKSPKTGKIQYSACALDFPVRNDNSCFLNETQCQTKECRMKIANSTWSSYMSKLDGEDAQYFCDNESKDSSPLHNAESPSPQNQLCKGKSSWEIMRRHEDFTSTTRLPENFQITSVTINYVMRGRRAIVMVLDKSESMRVNDNHKNLENHARLNVISILPTGIYLGLVAFDDDADILSNLTLLTEENRQEMANKITVELRGGETSIGGGILKAMEILIWEEMDQPGSEILLLTDGKETDRPYVKEVMPDVKEKGIKLQVVLIGDDAQQDLIEYSAQTEGIAYQYTGSEGTLGSFISETIHSGNTKESAPYLVSSSSINVAAHSTSLYHVYIDNDLGNETRFIFSWPDRSAILSVQIKDSNSQTVVHNATLQNTIFHAYEPSGTTSAGLWKVEIQNLGQDQVSMQIQVDSKKKDNSAQKPIDLEVSMSHTTLNYTGDTRWMSCPAVYGTLTRDYNPVCGATVTAKIKGRKTGLSLELPLYDSGSGVDILQNDGTYSSCIPPFNESDVYSIVVKVLGLNATVEMKPSGSPSSSTDDEEDDNLVEMVPAPMFQRLAIGPALSVVNAEVNKLDTTPPLEIHDLRIFEVDAKGNIIYLQFTAVGDDYDHGTAHHYEIRYADSIENISNNFDVSEAADIVSGSLERPGKPGQIETFGFRVRPNYNYCSAIRVWDDGNNSSPVSNVACGMTGNYFRIEEASTMFTMGEADLDLSHSTTPNGVTTRGFVHKATGVTATSFLTTGYVAGSQGPEMQTPMPSSAYSSFAHRSPPASSTIGISAGTASAYSSDRQSETPASTHLRADSTISGAVISNPSEKNTDLPLERANSPNANMVTFFTRNMNVEHFRSSAASEADSHALTQQASAMVNTDWPTQGFPAGSHSPEMRTSLTSPTHSPLTPNSSSEEVTLGVVTDMGSSSVNGRLSSSPASIERGMESAVSSTRITSESAVKTTNGLHLQGFSTSPTQESDNSSLPHNHSHNPADSSHDDLFHAFLVLIVTMGASLVCVVALGIILVVARHFARRIISRPDTIPSV